MPNTINVPENARGERLDRFLTTQGVAESRAKLQKAIVHGAIRLNDKKVAPHHFLKGGERITIDEEQQIIPEKIPETFNEIRVVHEEKDFAVLEKPVGVLVHSAEGTHERTIVDWLAHNIPESAQVGEKIRPGIVHRLDRDVSGLLVVAKTQEGYEELHAAFRERRVKKQYTALVHGSLERENGEITFPIRRSKTAGRMAAVPQNDADARYAETRYRVLMRLINATLVDVTIITGRSHQIRVHFYALGHPIVGDPVYHRKEHTSLPAERLYLHATSLMFPLFGRTMGPYHSPPPEAFSRLIQRLSPAHVKD